MKNDLKVTQKKLGEGAVKNSPRMTPAQLKLAAERMSKAIEERAARRAKGELKADDDTLEITEWL